MLRVALRIPCAVQRALGTPRQPLSARASRRVRFRVCADAHHRVAASHVRAGCAGFSHPKGVARARFARAARNGHDATDKHTTATAAPRQGCHCGPTAGLPLRPHGRAATAAPRQGIRQRADQAGMGYDGLRSAHCSHRYRPPRMPRSARCCVLNPMAARSLCSAPRAVRCMLFIRWSRR
jgi:hypothetical protein